MRTPFIARQGRPSAGSSTASAAERDSLSRESVTDSHFLGGYWIIAAVMVIAAVSAYYRRRWRESKRNRTS